MKLSIVATLYHSALYIKPFCQRIAAEAERLTDEYEIVLVNDGSPDHSLNIAVELASQDKHIVVVDLSRNFGHHKAMMTGLSHAHGERIFLIDTDLEEEPEWLSLFAAHMDKNHCDVVYGIQQKRKGSWFERISGQYFYAFFRFLTKLDMPANAVTARLMTRRYVNALLGFQEREIFIGGLWYITGFDQHPIAITKHNKGQSTYSLGRRFSLMVNSITSFSNTPLVMIFHCGIIIFILSFLMTCWLVIKFLFYAMPVSGWTSVMVSIWLLGGLIISFIGIIGIYISKIFSEAKQRPYTIIKEIYGR